MRIRVQLINEEDVYDALSRVSREGVAAIKDALNETALNVQTKARRLAPVDTGRLRASVRPLFTDVTGDLMAVAVGTDVEYAPYVEHGTRRMRAQPFLLPAWESERTAFMVRMRAAMQGLA